MLQPWDDWLTIICALDLWSWHCSTRMATRGWRLSSPGSCWLWPAADVVSAHLNDWAVLASCDGGEYVGGLGTYPQAGRLAGTAWDVGGVFLHGIEEGREVSQMVAAPDVFGHVGSGLKPGDVRHWGSL